MQAITRVIEEKEASIKAGLREVEEMRALAEEFPDLTLHTDRWKTERLSSAKVNSVASEVLLKHSCGCCSDSPLQAWPYIEKNGKRIFSSPPVFTVGEKNMFGSGEIETPGWEEPMRAAGISEAAIARVRAYLNVCRPESDEETDDTDS
jgi:hypothetical protein